MSNARLQSCADAWCQPILAPTVQGLEAGGAVHLYGRGTNFDIVSPRDHDALQAAEEALLGDLYEAVDFS